MFIQQTINIEISTEIEHIKRFSKQVIVVLKTSEHSDINFIHWNINLFYYLFIQNSSFCSWEVQRWNKKFSWKFRINNTCAE